MSSITQAKAEAQKLIKRYNRLQAEARSTSDSNEATRKATEAEKLVSQISALQSAISKLQAQDRGRKENTPREPRKPTQNAKEVETDIKRAEAEKTALESRINRIEAAQRRTREQIEQLSRAKQELARLRKEAEKNVHERRASDEKLQQELAKRIEQKEQEHSKLKDQLEAARKRAEKDAELLKLQRDKAREMVEKQRELDKDRLGAKSHRGASSSKGILIGVGITISIVVALITLVFVTPVFDSIPAVRNLKYPQVIVTQQENSPRTTQTSAIEKAPEVKRATIDPDKPKRVKALAIFRDRLKRGGKGPVMMKLPGDTFLMGSKASLPYQDERPQQQITLQGFSIGKYEVTFEEYDLFASDNNLSLPDDEGWGRENRPVVNVSWNDAVAYTQWLSQQTGRQYRLPSEREWEYAAAAGTTTTFWWGYKIGRNRANCAACGSQWSNDSTAPVGSFKPNAFGLNDTIGNVLEWTISCYHPNYQGAPQHGNVWNGGDCSRHMVRSSSFRSYKKEVRTTKRHHYSPGTKSNTLGFRVVRVD